MRSRIQIVVVILLGAVIALVWTEQLPSQEKQGQRKGGSNLGGYEKPPPANDVPSHLYDIVLGRPTKHGVTARIVSYEDLEGRLVYGSRSGEYSSKTTAHRLNKLDPVNFVIDTQSDDSRSFYRFEYRRRDSEPYQQSDEFTFHTHRSEASSFAFTVQSDSHLDENTSPAVYELTLANALANGSDFHLELGDTFMSGSSSSSCTIW